MPDRNLSEAARQMRRQFDQSFTEAIDDTELATIDVLLVKLAGVLHAIRLTDVAHLQVLKWVTPLPASTAALLGVAGLQGTVLPVYDLRMVLGLDASSPARWSVKVKSLPVGLAFDSFEEHVRCASASVSDELVQEGHGRHVRSWLRTPKGAWPLIDMPSVLETIQGLAQASPSREER